MSIAFIISLTKRTDRGTFASVIHIVPGCTLVASIIGIKCLTVGILEEYLTGSIAWV